MDLYDRIAGLCRRDGIRISALAKETGLRTSIFTELKMGRTKSMSVATLGRIADYFGVTLDYLAGTDAKPASELRAKRDRLCRCAMELDEQALDAVLQTAELLCARK
ncbi:MAG: helix-turn-helix transcriptional regulator [Clostridia bacterium]|nr:helix-turn-helix transcriptional regulator [Clostridia bacterium]